MNLSDTTSASHFCVDAAFFPPYLHSFPTRRSSDLPGTVVETPTHLVVLGNFRADEGNRSVYQNNNIWQWSLQIEKSFGEKDRKSTRLNSSHRTISYAAFCLKKKTPSPNPARKR